MRHDAWDDILDSKIWDLPQQSGVLPVLRLSYHHLPSHLKRCFAYCAIFPKDYEFNEKELTFLWMAGGIIRQSRKNERLEDLGGKCFHDLVSRSIFPQTSSGSSKFVMHDLIHDLAELVSRETIFRLEEANLSSRRFERIRHASYTRGRYDGKNKFKVFNEIEHLRTFLPLHERRGYYIPRTVLSDLLPKFRRLRMLSLQGYCIGELPMSFEDLRLLRLLNLADTDIRSLPESTCTLLNLEILILRNCSRLIKLPPKMRNLINLRHLDIRGAKLLKEMPFGMKELKNLQTLSNFIVGKGETASGLEDLKCLNFLCDELCMSGLENVNNPQNAREATVCEKHNLEALTLDWGSQFDNSRDGVVEEHVLEILQPHKCIKKVAIRNYGGARFPHWIGDPSFSKMKVLKLENCHNCVSLPSLGLLSSLKHLAVKGLKKLKSIESEVYGEGFSMPFPSLEILKPSIAECPKLSGQLPELLPSLETLVVSKCKKLFIRAEWMLYIRDRDCLTFIARRRLPASLKRLEIENCEKLQRLFDDEEDASSSSPSPASSSSPVMLQHLSIENCPELTSLSSGVQFLEALEFLEIRDCPELESILDGLPNLKCLQSIYIWKCPSLVSFPERGLPNTISRVGIGECDKLEALPNDLHKINSLRYLSIQLCRNLVSFPEEGFPTSLTSLRIGDFKMYKTLVQWGLHRLTSLGRLYIVD
ncbi:hypothetical protein CISIN_1g046587mg, partial [Citrus sinensis]